jgi:hypothetical protein
MLAKLGKLGNYSVRSKLHKVSAVKMISDAKATPGIVN